MKRLATTSTVVARKPHNSNAVNAAGERRPAMDHVGIDVHKRESRVCILTPDGEVTEVRIATTGERFRAVLGERPRAKVLIESSTESEWVARWRSQDSVDTLVSALVSGFELLRADAAQMAMPA
jgi:hypothetical protein